MSRATTYRRLLSAQLSLLVLGIALANALLLGLAVRRVLYQNLDHALLEIAATEAASSTDTGIVHLHDTLPKLLEIAGHPGYEKYVWIEDEREGLLARSSNLVSKGKPETDPRPEAEAWSGRVAYGWATLHGLRLRAVYYPARGPLGQRLLTVVAIPVGPVEQNMRSMIVWIVAVATVALGLGLAVVRGLARRATEPLRWLADQAARVGSPGQALSDIPAGVPIEVRQVAEALDRMLGRLAVYDREREQLVNRLRSVLADASHELRTPLANIIGTAEVALRRERSGGEYRQALETAGAEANRASRLVSDLLLLARADCGQLEPRREPVAIAEVLRAAMEAASSRTFGVRWTIEADGGRLVWADPDHLRRVVDNLLDNAARHAESEVAVTVRVVGDGVETAVANDGAPLEPGEEVRVFDRFYRGDSSRSRASGGSGLGLSIARSLVELHGGSIQARNTEAGVCFCFVLPLWREERDSGGGSV